MVGITAVASIGLHKTLVHTVAAEPDPKSVDGQTTPAEAQPAVTLLQTGKPQSTTPTDTKPLNTILTWTPTGVGDVQDVYNIRVATNPTVDSLTGVLTTDIVKSADASTTAQLSATDLPEGTYYWQVQSCSAVNPLVCNSWSEVWTQTVDGTAPAVPTATSTSKPYSQTVSFAGTAEAAATVTITVNDKACAVTAAADGSWSCTFSDEFAYGDYTASVKATDKAGNESTALETDFSVKELFVAPVIALEALPPALDIVPVDETPENKTIQTTETAVIDSVNTAVSAEPPMQAAADPVVKPLSTDGGIIQSSENGWQVFGLPWFIWVGSGAGIAGAMWAFGVPVPRRLTSMLSL